LPSILCVTRMLSTGISENIVPGEGFEPPTFAL
jgi:hypothetical protein